MASTTTVKRMLQYLHEAYPTRDISPLTLEAWCAALGDLTDDQVTAAVRKVLCESGRTFFPTPNEIRDAVPRKTQLYLANTNSEGAIERWYAERERVSPRIRYEDVARG